MYTRSNDQHSSSSDDSLCKFSFNVSISLCKFGASASIITKGS